jgi:hypothetical protein
MGGYVRGAPCQKIGIYQWVLLVVTTIEVYNSYPGSHCSASFLSCSFQVYHSPFSHGGPYFRHLEALGSIFWPFVSEIPLVHKITQPAHSLDNSVKPQPVDESLGLRSTTGSGSARSCESPLFTLFISGRNDCYRIVIYRIWCMMMHMHTTTPMLFELRRTLWRGR